MSGRLTLRCILAATLGLVLVAGFVSAVPGDGSGPFFTSGPVDPQAEDADIRSEERTIDSFDGTTLAATLYYDANRSDEPLSAVLAAHGWSQHRGHMTDTANWLAEQGYIVLAWDARGFGQSEGTVGLNGPDEWRDVSALIDWLADPGTTNNGPTIRMDDADDPRLGMVGGSYGGAIQLLAAAQDDRIDAIVPDITWNDLTQSLAPGGVVKRGWVDLLYWAGQGGSHGLLNEEPEPNTGGMDERLTQWYLEATTTGRLPEDAVDPLLERSPRTHNHAVRAHVLLTQGWHDTLFPPDEAAANHHDLKDRSDAETHLLLYPGGHGHSKGGLLITYREHVHAFLARHLHGEDIEPLPAVTILTAGTRERTVLEDWPPATQHAATQDLRQAGADDAIALAITPAPTSHTEQQALAGDTPTIATDLGDMGPLPTATLLPLGLQGPFTIQGNPRVNLTIEPDTDDLTLFLSLVQKKGERDTVLNNQVKPVRIEGQTGRTLNLEVPLIALAHKVPANDGLFLRIATSDTGYHGAREAGTVQIRLTDSILHLPLAGPPGVAIRPGEEEEPETQASPAVGPAAVVGALAGLLLRRRLRVPEGPTKPARCLARRDDG